MKMTDVYEIKIACSAKELPEVEALFEGMTTTTAYKLLPRFKVEFSAFMREKPKLPKGYGFTVTKLKKRNWLKESLVSFKPMQIGKFYIYGTHIKKNPPEKWLGIKVDAATAFGSGEHGTTQGCLLALSAKKTARRIADIGTGTGILAIGAKKLFPKATVIASDIDKEAVRVSKENARQNGVAVKCVLSDGTKQKDLNKKGHFDLVLANILARPLIEMSKDLYGIMQKDGCLIVSGLLIRQKKWVKDAFKEVGFTFQKAYDVKPWSTLMFKK